MVTPILLANSPIEYINIIPLLSLFNLIKFYFYKYAKTYL